VNKELLSPAIQGFERFQLVNIKYQNAAVSSTVECNAKTLEALLTSCVPDLRVSKQEDLQDMESLPAWSLVVHQPSVPLLKSLLQWLLCIGW